VNSESGGVWKEVVLACLKVPTRQLTGVPDEVDEHNLHDSLFVDRMRIRGTAAVLTCSLCAVVLNRQLTFANVHCVFVMLNMTISVSLFFAWSILIFCLPVELLQLH